MGKQDKKQLRTLIVVRIWHSKQVAGLCFIQMLFLFICLFLFLIYPEWADEDEKKTLKNFTDRISPDLYSRRFINGDCQWATQFPFQRKYKAELTALKITSTLKGINDFLTIKKHNSKAIKLRQRQSFVFISHNRYILSCQHSANIPVEDGHCRRDGTGQRWKGGRSARPRSHDVGSIRRPPEEGTGCSPSPPPDRRPYCRRGAWMKWLDFAWSANLSPGLT